MVPELVRGAHPTPPRSGINSEHADGQVQADAVSSNGQARAYAPNNWLYGNGGGASMADLYSLIQSTLHSTARTEIATLEIRRQLADLRGAVEDLALPRRGPTVHDLIRVLNAGPEARRAIKFPITWIRSGCPSPAPAPVESPAPSPSPEPAAPFTMDDWLK